jgi:hypothetical protein
MVRALLVLAALSATAGGWGAGFDQDREVQKLRAQFGGLTVVGPVLQDDFSTTADRRIAGPVTVADGVATYQEDRSEQLSIYYGVVVPKRGHLSVDFRLDRLPQDHNFMTLCSAGTAGNTKLMMRVGLDRRVRVIVLTRREEITLESDPVELGKMHRVEWWYAPEGGLLVVDGVVQDYSTDNCVPYAVEVGEAFWLGDQPWWDAGGRKGVFYPLDNFVGVVDGVELARLK